MDIRDYLAKCGELYRESLARGVDAMFLRKWGGAFAIAAQHADSIRIDRNYYLKMVDRQRNYDEIRQLAAQRWKRVRAEFEYEMFIGHPPMQAVEIVMRSYGTVPHTEVQLDKLVTKISDPTADFGVESYPWIVDLKIMSERVRRGSETMSSTFGAIVTGGYLIATAKDWQNATQEEWDKALNVGQLGIIADNLGGAWVGMREHRDANRANGSAMLQRPVAAEVAPTSPPSPPSPATRGTAGGKPSSTQRSTAVRATSPQAATQSTTPRSPAVQSGRPAPNARLAGSVVMDEFNVEGALDENAQHGPSSYNGGFRSVELKKHESGPNQGLPKKTLDSIVARMTPVQRRAVTRLVGTLPPALRSLWDQAATSSAEGLRQMAEVNRLWRSGNPAQMEEAYKLSESVYKNCRGRFWRLVRSQIKTDDVLKQQFDDAGLKFTGGNDTAPHWDLPGGKKEVLSVDHNQARRRDDPTRCIDSSNLVLTPGSENSQHLEEIRRSDPHQR